MGRHREVTRPSILSPTIRSLLPLFALASRQCRVARIAIAIARSPCFGLSSAYLHSVLLFLLLQRFAQNRFDHDNPGVYVLGLYVEVNPKQPVMPLVRKALRMRVIG
jgi:hypothetical protein